MNEIFLPGAVPAEHPPHLGQRDVGFINKHQKVIREVVHQGAGGAPRLPPRQHAGIVFNPLAEANLQEHFHIVIGALGDALCLDELSLLAEPLHPLVALLANLLHRLQDTLPGNDVVGGGVDSQVADEILHLAGDGVYLRDTVHLVPKEFHPVGGIGRVGWVYLHHIPPDSEFIADEIHVVALVLQLHQLADKLVPLLLHPLAQGDNHVLIVDGVPQGVDTGDAGYNDNIPPLRQGGGGGVAQTLNLVVDGAVLFNIGIGGGDVGLRLVVVVIGDKIFHRVMGEELLELGAELGRQGFVVGQDEGGAVQPLDDIRHGEGLARSGDPFQDLFPVPGLDTLHQGINGLGLVPGGLEG